MIFSQAPENNISIFFTEICTSQGAPPVTTTLVANLPHVQTTLAANLLPVSTTLVANLPPVSATSAENFATVTAGVIDTSGT
jgi:hypothetical protein